RCTTSAVSSVDPLSATITSQGCGQSWRASAASWRPTVAAPLRHGMTTLNSILSNLQQLFCPFRAKRENHPAAGAVAGLRRRDSAVLAAQRAAAGRGAGAAGIKRDEKKTVGCQPHFVTVDERDRAGDVIKHLVEHDRIEAPAGKIIPGIGLDEAAGNRRVAGGARDRAPRPIDADIFGASGGIEPRKQHSLAAADVEHARAGFEKAQIAGEHAVARHLAEIGQVLPVSAAILSFPSLPGERDVAAPEALLQAGDPALQPGGAGILSAVKAAIIAGVKTAPGERRGALSKGALPGRQAARRGPRRVQRNCGLPLHRTGGTR